MANFDDIKNAVIDTAGTGAEKARDIAENVADRAKDVFRVAKLNIEITQEKDSIKKAYAELGKLYYETHKDDPEPFCVQLCDEVTIALENIAAKEAEIAEIKAKNVKEEEPEDDVVVEFENIVADAEEKAEAVEDKVEDVAEAVEDKAEDVVEAVEDKAEDVVEAVEEKAEEAADAIKEVVDDILD